MRSKLAAMTSAVLLLVPGTTFAANAQQPPMNALKCDTTSRIYKVIGTTPWPSYPPLPISFGTDPNVMKSEIASVVSCPSACYDLSVGITLTTTGFSVQLSSQNKCADKTQPPDKQKPPRGCQSGQQQPQVTITVTQGQGASGAVQLPKKITKSRCNVDAISGALSSVGSSGTASIADVNNALKQLQNAPDMPVSSALPDGVQKVLNGAFDLNSADGQAQAAQALQDSGMSSQDAKDAIAKLASGDSTGGTQEITSKLNLNPDLTNIGSVQPTDGQTTQDGGAFPSQAQTGDNTFNQNGNSNTAQSGTLPTECGIPGAAGNVLLAESHCGANTYQPLSSVQGPGQFLCSTWNNYAQSTGYGSYSCSCTSGGQYAGGCSSVNNIQSVAQVLNAKNDQFQQQYGSQCESAGLTWSSCFYAIHVFGEGGFKNMLAAESSNPNASSYSLCGSALQQIACSNNKSIITNGGTVQGVFAELDRRQGANGTVVSSYSSSPFSFSSGGQGSQGNSILSAALGGAGSPFGNMYSYNPQTGTYQQVSGSGNQGGSSLFGTILSLIKNAGANSGNSGSSSGSSSSGSGGGSSSGGSSNPPAVTPQAALAVQPDTAAIGAPLHVSWSTIGMDWSRPCKLILGTTTITMANQGSQSIPTGALKAGTYHFTLECTSAAGNSISEVSPPITLK